MNRKRKSAHRRTISVLLTVCMLVACLPLNALSAGEPPAAGSAALPPAETSNIEESSEVCIVEEDLSKRGEYEKHFLCSDGTYIAVTYAEPVHYLDADGTWADTDVALSLNTASSRYEAQSGGFAVSFASAYSASAQQPAAVSMTDGAFPVSWTTAVAGTLLPAAGRSGLQASASFDALVPYTPSVSVLTAQQSQAASLQSFAGRPVADADSFAAPDRISVAQYTGIAQTAGQSAGVSLRYSVSQHRIKEDIIIADKSAVTDFVTTLDIGALTAAPQDDGSVLLTDGNGDTVYTVGVPYLYDAEYNVSYDVEVTVSQTGSVCRITYSPDREWMFSDERVYPVVLDPTITSSEYAANIVDTYVTQADSNNHSGEGNLVVGIKSGKINRAYIKINNLPSLPDDVVPLSANLTIKHGANTTTGRTMTLYRVNSSWSPSSITYANQPTSFTTIASCAFNTSNVSFDLSQSQTRDLYTRKANGTNYGYRIRYSSESTTNPDYNMLRSMEYPTASEQPCFTVRYGYSLPTGLATRIIYSFKNAGSVKYLDVSGGTDADNTNVIQYTGNDTAAQQFKLELSSTGNGYILRSQVGGKTRVLDIYKTNGRVENGNNVQIYRNVDPIAQEWLIIHVSQYYYKIVPRSNPALALTSYGSSNGSSTGKSTTSAGNVFVSTYTGAINQLWEIFPNDVSISLSEVTKTLYVTGTLDLNDITVNVTPSIPYVWSLYSGSGIVSYNSTTKIVTALSEGTAVFRATAFGGEYATLIIHVEKAGYNLNITGTQLQNAYSGKYADIYSKNTSNGTIVHQYEYNFSDSHQWEFIYQATSGYYLIKNVRSGKYLSVDNISSPGTSDIVINSLTSSKKGQLWRIKEYGDEYKIYSDLDPTHLCLALSSVSNSNDIQLSLKIDFADSTILWYFGDILPDSSQNGLYYITNVMTEKALDLDTGTSSVQQWEMHGRNNQIWKITHVTGDKYIIKSMAQTRENSMNITASAATTANNQFECHIRREGNNYLIYNDIQNPISVSSYSDGASVIVNGNYKYWNLIKYGDYVQSLNNSDIYNTYSAYSITNAGHENDGSYHGGQTAFSRFKEYFWDKGYQELMTWEHFTGKIDREDIVNSIIYSKFAYIDSHSPAFGEFFMYHDNTYYDTLLLTDFFENGSYDLNADGTSKSLFTKNTDWLIVNSCSQFDNLESAQNWGKLMLGNGHRLHGVLGYYDAAPGTTLMKERFDDFFENLDNGDTFITAWKKANNEGSDSNWAVIYHDDCEDDKLTSLTNPGSGNDYTIKLLKNSFFGDSSSVVFSNSANNASNITNAQMANFNNLIDDNFVITESSDKKLYINADYHEDIIFNTPMNIETSQIVGYVNELTQEYALTDGESYDYTISAVESSILHFDNTESEPQILEITVKLYPKDASTNSECYVEMVYDSTGLVKLVDAWE